MPFTETLVRFVQRLHLWPFAARPSPSGLVAAVVGVDSSREGGDWMTAEQEQEILAILIRAVEAEAGRFDAAERNSTQVLWYFFGEDVRRLEAALLPALRSQPRCAGGLLRLTSNGVVGPWREIRI